jgi:two-component system, cell cycle sensor histidine kinase and response regulator CckA
VIENFRFKRPPRVVGLYWLVAVGAGAVGFALNGFLIQIFQNIEIIIGGVCALLVALTLGPGYGAAAAALAAARTILLWRHPYAVVFYVPEAFVVGWLKRRGVSPLLADFGYWIAALPFLYMVFGYSGLFATSVGWAIILKYQFNGLLCVILAETILTLPVARPWLERIGQPESPDRTLRSKLYRTLIVIAILPPCALAIMTGRQYADRQETEASFHLAETAATIKHAAGDYVNEHRRAIALLAKQCGGARLDPTTLRREVAHFHSQYEGFTTLFVVAADGRPLTVFPEPSITAPHVALHAPPPNLFAERPHLFAALETRRTVVSTAFVGRGAGSHPSIAVSAPISDETGAVVGVVEGDLNLAKFQRLSTEYQTLRGVNVIVADQANRIVYSNRPDEFPLLKSVSDTPLTRNAATAAPETAFRYNLPPDAESGVVGEGYLALWTKDDSTGWSVYAQQPASVIQQETQRLYLRMFGLMLASVALAVALAHVLASSVTVPLERLMRAVRNFSADGDETAAPQVPPPPPATPVEIADLTKVFDEMSVKLNRAYSDLQRTVAERESANQKLQAVLNDLDWQVRERTAQLAETIEQLKRSKADAERRQEQLRQSQKMEAIGQLAGGIAHNFNNLLAIIIGYNGLELNRTDPDGASYKSAKAIKKAAERGRDLVRQLMSFSRNSEIHAKNLDLHESIRSTAAMVGRVIGEDIAITLALDAAETTVYADAQEIEQVFLNLLLNARDAMPNGGLITIATAEETPHGNFQLPTGRIFPNATDFLETLQTRSYIRVTVSDTGSGMDADTQERLFEPFFTTKEQGRGTGLGLATVFGTVTQRKGFIRVESELGHGSTFHIYLPLENEAPATTQSSAYRFPPRIGALVAGETVAAPTVLVVEDEPGVLEIACEVLQENGFTTLAAADGAQALEVSRRHPGDIHLVLTDVRMPGLNGPQLASQITKERVGVPVLFMSGYVDSKDTGDVFLSEEIFITKPFEAADLIKKVQGLLNGGRAAAPVQSSMSS